jgi:hypothetical protein
MTTIKQGLGSVARTRIAVAAGVMVVLSVAMLVLWLHAASASATKGDRLTAQDGQISDLTKRLADEESTLADVQQSLDDQTSKVIAWRSRFDARVRTKTSSLRLQWMTSARESVFSRGGITEDGTYLVQVAGLGTSPSFSDVSPATEGTCFQISAGTPLEIACGVIDTGGGTGSGGGGDGCNTNYSGCLLVDAGDYDCEGGSGDGPNYTGTVEVLGYDEYGLDADGDGIGCDG